MSIHHATAPLAGARIDSPTAAAEHAPGTRIAGTDGTEWLYVRAAGAIARYDYVTVDEAFKASAGTKAAVDSGHAVALAQAAFAEGGYGWVATAGLGAALKVNVLARCAADTALYTTARAGKLDDANSNQTEIAGIAITTAAGGAAAARPAIVAHPRAG